MASKALNSGVAPTYSSENQLNELSSVIGELRNFAAGQSVTNQHILDELKKISDRMSSFGEVSATFQEYRNVLHERFGKIHSIITELDERMDRVEAKLETTSEVIATWKGQIKTLIWMVGIGGTIISSLLSTYGAVVLKALAVHS